MRGPVAMKIADDEKRSRGEDHIVRRREVEGPAKGRAGVGNDFEGVRKVARDGGQDARGNGARLRRLRENDGRRLRKQKPRNLVHRLVAHGAVNQVNAAAGQMLGPESGQLAGAGRIVRAVEIHSRAVLNALDAPGPVDRREALRDGGIVDGEAPVGKEMRGGDSGDGVANLKPARQRQRYT